MITFAIRNRQYEGYKPEKPPVWVNVERRGKVFVVGDREVELFPIRVLAEALDRTSDVIMRWERSGQFPKPIFEVPSEKLCGRWYSKEQITNMHRIFRFTYGGTKRWKSTEKHQRQMADFGKVYYCTQVVVDEKGVIHV